MFIELVTVRTTRMFSESLFSRTHTMLSLKNQSYLPKQALSVTNSNETLILSINC